MARALALLTNAFPLWVLAAGLLGLANPQTFTWFSGTWIVAGLAVIMLGMGIMLTPADFRAVARRPRPIALGFFAQYTVMPLLAWSIGAVLNLPAPFAVGLILVGCCPGGTASNVLTFLARADVALSVAMTAISTLAAAIMTPLLIWVLAGARVEVDAWALCRTTVEMVILPVVAGMLLNQRLPRLVGYVQPVAPLVSVLTIALICGSIVGQNASAIRAGAGQLLAAVALLHAGGFGLGYAVARLLRQPIRVARTVAIEVGMQNSGLGVVMARRHFADPLTAVPGALSAVMHSVLGSLMVAWWRWRDSAAGKMGRPPAALALAKDS